MFHEHPLIYGSDFPTFVCKLCGEEKKEGNKCINCDFKLCEECSNKIFTRKRKENMHEHKMFLCERKNWTCNQCNKNFESKISFFCKECNIDYCLECFLE